MERSHRNLQEMELVVTIADKHARPDFSAACLTCNFGLVQEHAKEMVQEVVVWPMLNPDLFQVSHVSYCSWKMYCLMLLACKCVTAARLSLWSCLSLAVIPAIACAFGIELDVND